jgi:hypothetical protein
MTSDWNIRIRAELCSLTGQPFVEKQLVHSALFYLDGEYLRKDYAVADWRERDTRPGLLSSWTSNFKPAPPAPPETLKKDDAESLLRRLIIINHPAQAPARYILALMLERKRLIREIERKTIDGQPVLIYEHINTGDVWVIHDPQLKLATMETVQTEVSRLLAEGKP